MPRPFDQAFADGSWWGRLVENAVGARLFNGAGAIPFGGGACAPGLRAPMPRAAELPATEMLPVCGGSGFDLDSRYRLWRVGAVMRFPLFASNLLRFARAGLLLGVAASAHAQEAQVRRLDSPDRRIEVSIQPPAPGANGSPGWSATFRGRPILTGCALSLHVAGGGASRDLLEDTRVVREQRRAVDEPVPVLFGRASRAINRFRELRLTLENARSQAVDVVFRCYDDAVAFRYEVLANGAASSIITVTEEATSFRFAGEPTAWVQYLENHRTSHEHEVIQIPYGDVRPDTLVDLPLTLSWPDGTHVAVSEAALRRYAGMALMRRPGGNDPPELLCRLTPRPDGNKVVRPLPMQTPWRVLLIADRPGALLESETIYCLNEPPVTGDWSWVRPGKITFPWWNGDVYDGRPGPPILSFEMASRYIDFCARHGLPIHSLTSTENTVTPWYQQSKPGVEPGPDTDVTRPREGFELERIRRYAESRGVRLWTWVHQGALRGRVEEAFAAFERLGWSGMMVDFFDHDDQESIEFSEAVLEAAARHRILIHLHGVWKPTGLERTYPNLMNHEGALNFEYLKWSDRCPPGHTLRMVFTRLVAGPMDYHLGGFRAVNRAQFEARNVAPLVLGTRAHMLALYVCLDNPAPMVADYPAAYEGQAGFEFLQRVPTWWDETRVLVAEVGELLVTARRKGTTWYVGGISAGRARELKLPLTFLGPANHVVRVWKDAPDTAADPNRLSVETLRLTAADTLSLRLAPDGGFASELAPGGR